MTDSRDDVLVVTGAGGMGEAVVRRLGSGRQVLLADYSPDVLGPVVERLADSGYRVSGVVTDVSDRAAVDALAKRAAETGRIAAVVHTAGVSAATATSAQIVAVDIVGTVHVIDAFAEVAEPGMSLVCVASMAGHHAQLDPATEKALATGPVEELPGLDAVAAVAEDPIMAYIVAKRANQLRVQAAALDYNRRGARVNTVSPGVISTAMARAEAASATGEHMLAMLDSAGIGRMGTTGELAEAVAYLAGPESRYVTGTDLLIDGGQAAWIRWHMTRP